eukprot:TRINITY_DN87_c7_g1_i2.p1 TRINITY_DN87_c7_g1~~TRINITY_DN87_c7_g1_i2.p1  ORF type:complete len:521 (+),score=78.51 TRINITY_DN87_c7_g1_i2:102-1565(+)
MSSPGCWYRSVPSSSKWVKFTALQNKNLDAAKSQGKKSLRQGVWTVTFASMTAVHKNGGSVNIHRTSGSGDQAVTRSQSPVSPKKGRKSRSQSPQKVKRAKSGSPSPKVKRSKKASESLVIPPSVQAVIFGSNLLTAPAAAALKDCLQNTPPISRIPLHVAASKMVKNVRSFLTSIGRLRVGDKFDIHFPKNHTIDSGVQFSLHPNFPLSGTEILNLMQETRITLLDSKNGQRNLLPFGHDMTDAEQLDSQLFMVSGPVYVAYDSNYDTQKKGSVVHCCSTPGINFAYSSADVQEFTRLKASGRSVLRVPTVKARMSQIWYHTLTVMAEASVAYPVLCAIGCGEFKGSYDSVPRLWATTLAEILSKHDFEFAAIIVSLPTFGNNDNYSEFAAALSQEPNLKVPVLLVENFGMLTIADRLASQGHYSGVLNPSDVEAVRKGHIGMFWDDGHIALEEIIAMQTTLLLHHKSINRSVWSQRPDIIEYDSS